MSAPGADRVSLAKPEVALVLVASALLSALGAYAVNLTSGIDAPALSGLALRQGLFLAVGAVAGAAVCVPHFRRIGRIAWPIYFGALGLLVFLLIPAVPRWLVTPRNGARAWIDLGPINLQPGEFAKIAYLLALAWYLRYRKNYRRVLGFVPPALITFVPVTLIILQPDLGTATLFVPALFATLVAAGAKLKHIAWVVAMGALLAPAAYPFLLPHQRERILALVSMAEGDMSAADSSQYQTIKAVTLAGAGGAIGAGDSRSRALLEFNDLPEAHNDMVFAVVMNRFGFAGAIGALLLEFLWIAGATLTAARCKDPFGRLMCVGCAAFVGAQTFINVGMCLGVLPIVGITLPFVSYGGSSALTSWLMTGLVLNVGMRPPTRLARKSFEYDEDDDG